MDIEWISELQQEMDRLEAQLRFFLDESPSLDLLPHEQGFLNSSLPLIQNLLVWSRTLSADAGVWALVDVPRLRHKMIGRFALVSVYFKAIGKNLTLASRASPAAASIKTLISRCDQLGYMIGGSQQLGPRPQADWPFYMLHPDTLLDVLRVSLYPDSISVWNVSPMPANVLVPFHPYYTQNLLCFLMERFKGLARANEVTLHATATTECLTMTITAPNILLTEVLWRDFLEALRSSAHDETIEVGREMGGQIDPLTWDEGQGEGVIVRLPWAR